MKLSLTITLGLFFFFSADAIEAATPWRASVKSESAAIYAGVSETNKVVAVLSRGDAVIINMELTTETGKWYSITTEGGPDASGYISGENLLVGELATASARWEWQPPPPPEPPPAPEAEGASFSKGAIAARSKGAVDLDVKSFIVSTFGRSLPVSAFGQTRFHSRMGFDHRNGVDVALSPDSSEGRALLNKLRQKGVAFTAFRRAVRGIATGAHIHVGKPSRRR